MKNSFLIIVPILLVIVVGIILVFTRDYNSNLNTITLIQYKPGEDEIIKKVDITNKDKINEISKYVDNLKPLTEDEMVNLMLYREIVIEYDHNITVGINIGQENYCDYINKAEGINSLSKLPKELYDLVINELK